MSTAYDIYDDESGNLVGSFASEQAALAMVARAVKRSGATSVAAWSLGTTELSGEVSRGEQLIHRAMHSVTQ